ncbi:MAG: TolC family protein, partial [Odoribacter sp.]|nr:TolC family protein [Odoribacter sp.]
MKRGVFITCMAIVIPWMLQAQNTTEEPQKLSLNEAVEFAVKYNKELQASQLNIELRNKMVTEAISQGLPQIDGSLAYSTNFGEKVHLGGMEMKMKDQINLNVSVSQLLFSGQWILGIKTSRIAKQIASQQVDITELDIKETVYNSYYNILASERLMNIVRENLENMNKIMEHTENMYKAGAAEVTDVDQIRITVGQLKNSYLAMQRTVDVNYNVMRLYLGLSAGTPLTLTDELPKFLELGSFLTLASQNFDVNSNAQYQLMTTQEELQKKMGGLKKWAYAPTLAATYTFSHQLKSGGFMNMPHSAGITLIVPVFSGLQRKSQLDQEK